jgi:hypothetical protein
MKEAHVSDELGNPALSELGRILGRWDMAITRVTTLLKTCTDVIDKCEDPVPRHR